MAQDLTPGVRWLSVAETCAFYGVSRRTIYNWVAADKVETRRTPGGALRIAVDVTAWAAARPAEAAV